jgi:GNAT superfamily N-acetyltransferase
MKSDVNCEQAAVPRDAAIPQDFMQFATVPVRPAALRRSAAIIEFNLQLAAETEDKTLDREQLSRGVSALLADPAKGRYFVAEIDGTIAGQIMHAWEWSDWRNGVLWWLQSVYVRPQFRGHGVFRALFEHVLAWHNRTRKSLACACTSISATPRHAKCYTRGGLEPAGYDVLERIWKP